MKKKYTYEELLEFENNDTKSVNLLLCDIWMTDTGLKWEECFCGKTERLRFNKHFFNWLRKEKL